MMFVESKNNSQKIVEKYQQQGSETLSKMSDKDLLAHLQLEKKIEEKAKKNKKRKKEKNLQRKKIKRNRE